MINTKKIIEEIEIANNWRLNEFLYIQNIYAKLSLDKDRSSELQKYVLKSAIPMIYAHWEGFVVSSLKIVFEVLNKENLTCKNIHNILLTCSYEQKLKSLTESAHFEKYQKHLAIIIEMFEKQVTFSNKIDTKSNLNFEVLVEICKKLRFDSSIFEEYKHELNQLIHVRNSLAHGENSYTFSKLQEIEKYFTLFSNVSSKFLFEIELFFNEKKYLQE